MTPAVAPLLLAVAQAAAPVRAGTARAVVALRVQAGEVRVDGRLDEAAWQRAGVAAGFRQREPREGQAASEDTEVRILFDEQSLYVGVLARDREPEKVVARILQRDKVMEARGLAQRSDFVGDDGVAILLDPFHDRRNGVVFATNANGALFDALITDEGETYNADWHGVWDVRAQRTPEGWSAEFAIPFGSLRYPEAGNPGTWGFNAYRLISRRNEQTLWAAWQREGGGFNRVSQAGVVEGLNGLPRGGLKLDLKPFGLAGLDQDLEGGASLDAERRLDAGLDLKWELRPGLVLDGTLNSDFAQVEADDEQVNLSRFDLFFPEKRDFFLENAGIFEFGTRGFFEPPPFLLFFSRRIGLVEDEDDETHEVPVIGGLRLSGRAGAQTVGLLDMVTGPALGEGHVNHGVLRVKRDVGASSYLGAMLTDRRSRDASASSAGLDASFWPTSSLNLQGFYARTTASGPGGDDQAWRAAFNYEGSAFGLEAAHLMVGPEADAPMGFVTRTDMRRSDASGRATLRPAALGMRKADFYMSGQYIAGTQGGVQDWNVGPFLVMEWNSGERLAVFHSRTFTRLDESFELADRVTVPPGDFPGTQTGFFAHSSVSRWFTLSADGEWQRNYGGRVDRLGASVGLSPGKHLSLGMRVGRNRADLPGGAFVGDIASLRLGWAFTTRVWASAFVQYNSLDDKIVANLRLNVIHRPGSDLFLVYNEERSSETGGPGVVNRALALKVTWLVRF